MKSIEMRNGYGIQFGKIEHQQAPNGNKSMKDFAKGAAFAAGIFGTGILIREATKEDRLKRVGGKIKDTASEKIPNITHIRSRFQRGHQEQLGEQRQEQQITA